jgi:hypothetical protein
MAIGSIIVSLIKAGSTVVENPPAGEQWQEDGGTYFESNSNPLENSLQLSASSLPDNRPWENDRQLEDDVRSKYAVSTAPEAGLQHIAITSGNLPQKIRYPIATNAAESEFSLEGDLFVVPVGIFNPPELVSSPAGDIASSVQTPWQSSGEFVPAGNNPWDSIPESLGLPISPQSSLSDDKRNPATTWDTAFQNAPLDVSEGYTTTTHPATRNQLAVFPAEPADTGGHFDDVKPLVGTLVEPTDSTHTPSQPSRSPTLSAADHPAELSMRPRFPPPSWTSSVPLRPPWRSPTIAATTRSPSLSPASQGTGRVATQQIYSVSIKKILFCFENGHNMSHHYYQ